MRRMNLGATTRFDVHRFPQDLREAVFHPMGELSLKYVFHLYEYLRLPHN